MELNQNKEHSCKKIFFFFFLINFDETYWKRVDTVEKNRQFCTKNFIILKKDKNDVEKKAYKAAEAIQNNRGSKLTDLITLM